MRIHPHIVLAALLSTGGVSQALDAPPLPVKAANDDGWRPASQDPNWIDNLPFKILFNQSLGYNDNLLLLPNGVAPSGNEKRGDAYSTTTFGLFSRFPLEGGAFFVNGTYGVQRYQHDTTLNSSNYALNAGMDWVFTSRCSGTLVGSATQAQAPIELLTSFSVNNIRTAAFNETAKCSVADHINLILNSGISRSNNSLETLVINDFDQKFVTGGLEYDYGDLNTIGVRTTLTKTDYINRTPISAPGLATNLDQIEYAFYVHRVLTAKLSVDGNVGVVQSTTSSPGLSSTFTNPTYGMKVRWEATPKLAFEALFSQTVTPPQNIVADFQRTRSETLTAIYLFSPKLSFTWSIGIAELSNPTSSGINQSPILVNQKDYFSDLRAIYQITPLINATGEYRYTDRKDETTGLRSTSNLFLVGVAYQR